MPTEYNYPDIVIKGKICCQCNILQSYCNFTNSSNVCRICSNAMAYVFGLVPSVSNKAYDFITSYRITSQFMSKYCGIPPNIALNYPLHISLANCFECSVPTRYRIIKCIEQHLEEYDGNIANVKLVETEAFRMLTTDCSYIQNILKKIKHLEINDKFYLNLCSIDDPDPKNVHMRLLDNIPYEDEWSAGWDFVLFGINKNTGEWSEVKNFKSNFKINDLGKENANHRLNHSKI